MKVMVGIAPIRTTDTSGASSEKETSANTAEQGEKHADKDVSLTVVENEPVKELCWLDSMHFDHETSTNWLFFSHSSEKNRMIQVEKIRRPYFLSEPKGYGERTANEEIP